MSYKVGSFNVRNLNFASNGDSRRSYETISQIIKDECYDIIALQEILSPYVWSILKQYLGSDWRFAWEQPNQYFGNQQGDRRGEGYAYIWNSRRIDLVSENINGDDRIFQPRIWKQYKKQGKRLVREPYYARFTPNGKLGGCFCEIRLINTHIVYGDGNKLGEIMRVAEFEKLARDIYEHISNKVYYSSMPAYTIILGDYNLDIGKILPVPFFDKNQIGRVVTLQGELTTLNRIKSEDGTESADGYANNYDHISCSERVLSTAHITSHKVDAVEKYTSNNFDKYLKEVSDHVPILMDIDLKYRK